MAAYTGAGVERLAYHGFLQKCDGFVTGEIPAVPGLVASGLSEVEVRETLQGLLEEHIEEMLDDDAILPPDNTTINGKPEIFHVVVPSTARRSVLMSFHGADELPHNQQKALCFKAVVLQNKTHLQGHFPDLTGAFTSGRNMADIQTKLQRLLETYIGLMIKSGEEVPLPKFKEASELQMTEEELATVVGLPVHTVDVPV